MAVYTSLTKDQIEAFLSPLDCGKLVSFDGILQGVENTNYKIVTDKDQYILTVFETRTNREDLPFFFNFMKHLNGKGIYCPFILASGEIEGKAAALISFLEGSNIAPDTITPQMCFETGILLARMHQAALDFPQSRENSMSVAAWKKLFEKTGPLADDIVEGMADLMDEEIDRAEKTLSADLPKAVVHADLFPDNVFARNGHVEGVIDFYFSSTDYLIYDLAITFNAWCFENGTLNKDRALKMIEGYETIRRLSSEEKSAFQDMARAAALRIMMTRAHDWVFHDPANLVKPKDPLEYKKILDYHRSHNALG